jgi:hypothetical protein
MPPPIPVEVIPERTERFHVFLTPEEKQMVLNLAARRGVNQSTLFRLWIRDTHATEARPR